MKTPEPKTRPAGYYLLSLMVFFQTLSGLYGGGALALYPDGSALRMPLELLAGSPFDTYLVPGLILFLVLGLFPLVVFYGLVRRTAWARTGALLVGLGLVIWITVEIALVGYHADPPLQLIYGMVGLLVLVFSQLPSVQIALNAGGS